MTKINNKCETGIEVNHIPVSFKVVGVESCGAAGIKPVIDAIIGFGYECVECVVATSRHDCIPADDDKLAIIVAVDNAGVANDIARNYHNAGVLTLGLLEGADPTCFDSMMTVAPDKYYADMVKALLQPLVTQGYICYDFNDLCTTLRNTRFFRTLIVEGKDVESSVAKMQEVLNGEGVNVDKIEYLSAHLYFNRQRQPAMTMEDVSFLSDMLSKMPESVNVIWSVNFDDTLPLDQIRFTLIMSGKEL